MQVFAAAEALAISATGAWTEVDLTAAPYNVPATASFALLHVVLKKTTAPATTFQVRSAASAQGTYGAEESSQDFTATVMSVLAPLSGGKFDYHSTATTASGNIEVAVVGYFSALDGAAFNTSIDITPADPGLPSQHPLLEGWETLNVGAYVPSTFNLAVCSYHDSAFGPDKLTIAQDNIRHSFDVRVTGGSAVISETSDSYGGYAAGDKSVQYFLAPLDALGRFDIYGYAPRNDAGVSRTVLLHGYLKANLNASPLTVDTYTFTNPSSSVWLERTASVAARAVLVYFRNSDSWNAAIGYRMKGEVGAYTTAMESGESVRGIQQGVIPLDGSSKWEEFENFGATFSGIRSYTIAYFLTEELLEETAAVTDELKQDLYTREVAETAAVTDTLAVGDVHDDTIAESAAAADAVTAEHAKGGVAVESAAVVDTVEVEHTSPAVAGQPGDTDMGVNVTGSGTGLYGATGEGESAADLAATGEGVAGAVGEGGGAARVSAAGEGLFGGAATGEGQVRVTGSGAGDVVPAAEAAVAGEQYQTFAMNLLTGAVTQHSTQFNSRCLLRGSVYAAGPDGIYLIGGKTDNGAAIPIVISKFGINAGSSRRKSFTDAFIRMASDGDFDLAVFADGVSGTVVLYDGIPAPHLAKADLPRGVAGGELGFTLQNRNGATLLGLFEAEFFVRLSEVRKAWRNHG